LNTPTHNENAVPEKFRVKLLAAMIFIVFVITAGSLYFAQKNADAADQEHLDREFRNEFARKGTEGLSLSTPVLQTTIAAATQTA